MLAEWLFTRYIQLLQVFYYRVFSLDDACKILKENKARVRVILSELCKRGWIYRLRRGFYLILSPYVMLIRGDWEKKVKQRIYLPLILSVSTRLIELFNDNLISIVIFGSVARGEARPNSDLDVLVIAKNIPEKYSKRIDLVIYALESLKELKVWLWENEGIYCNVELLILNTDEAKCFQPIYLDMIYDSIIVYDKNDFFKNILREFTKKLKEIGAERVELPGGKWFWRLKPEIKRGEVIEL